jgi:osmotically-inducible protein OsmY
MTNTNEALQKSVQDAIKWEPLLRAAEIGVTVQNGVVTLTGTVNSFSKKAEAEHAAKNVAGVKVVIEKIEIHFDDVGNKQDSEIANEALNAFKWNWAVPSELIKIKVEDGWVSLEGEVEWNYQKDAAKKAVSNIEGVKGVMNFIIVKSKSIDKIEKEDIENAFVRHWSLDDKAIHVNVLGNKVTLTGEVHSLYQKEEASRIAWNASGVSMVYNDLEINHN